jgi:hypothetical protein
MGRLTTLPGDIAKGWRLLSVRAAALVLVVLMCSGGLSAYSVLTHEQIVDLAWTDQIRPLLLKRYPGLSEDQIREAHAYAYGGAVIQDLGYYPFGSREFSNLVHYVRSGDFVLELIGSRAIPFSAWSRRIRNCFSRTSRSAASVVRFNCSANAWSRAAAS